MYFVDRMNSFVDRTILLRPPMYKSGIFDALLNENGQELHSILNKVQGGFSIDVNPCLRELYFSGRRAQRDQLIVNLFIVFILHVSIKTFVFYENNIFLKSMQSTCGATLDFFMMLWRDRVVSSSLSWQQILMSFILIHYRDRMCVDSLLCNNSYAISHTWNDLEWQL